MSDIKEALCSLAENNKETLNNIADYIHANPKLGCEEVKASAKEAAASVLGQLNDLKSRPEPPTKAGKEKAHVGKDTR